MVDQEKPRKPGTWAKGQSGNPTGANKKDPAARAGLAKASPDAVALLHRIVKGEDDKGQPVFHETKDRISAARVILDWALPKPAPERDNNAAARALELFAQALATGGPPPADDEEDGEP